MGILGDVASSVGKSFGSALGRAAGNLVGSFFGGGTPTATGGTSVSVPGLMSPTKVEDVNKNFSAGGGGVETAKAGTSKETILSFPGDNSMALANVWNQFLRDQLLKEPAVDVDKRRKTRR